MPDRDAEPLVYGDARMWMWEIGVERDRFNAHLFNSHCQTAGCVPATDNPATDNPILAAFRARFVRNPEVNTLTPFGFFEAGWRARDADELRSAAASSP